VTVRASQRRLFGEIFGGADVENAAGQDLGRPQYFEHKI
jgi:hypothetical protein